MASLLACAGAGRAAAALRAGAALARPRLAATPLVSSFGLPSTAASAPARTVTHYYGGLDAQLRNSAGAKPQPVDVPFVDQVRAEHLLKMRFHVGHHKRKLNRHVSGQIYGFRHNIAVFDIAKSWRSLRTIFYAFAEMAHLRSSFFLLAPNSSLPMQKLIERMRSEYPFKYNRFSSLYMLGYADQRYIDGTFSNWKQTYAFYEHVQRVLKDKPSLKRFRRLQRYLRGIDSVDLMGRVVPDFMLVFATDRGAMHEAANLDIPLVGMVDSNTSPAQFLYPVFGNDDSVESVAFMMDLLARAAEEGRKREHEAFATVMVAKLKQRLAEGAPVTDVSRGQLDLTDSEEEEEAGSSSSEMDEEKFKKMFPGAGAGNSSDGDGSSGSDSDAAAAKAADELGKTTASAAASAAPAASA